MKNFWASYLAIAALVGLLAFEVSPAWAYYPPVAATAQINDAGNTVSIIVVDPKTNITHSNHYSELSNIDLKQDNGVIAWSYFSDSGYKVTCATYDPFLSTFITDTLGPFDEAVSHLTVKDGVVAFGAKDSGDGVWPAFRGCRSTYDPLNGWHPVVSPVRLPDGPITDIYVKDGVVVFMRKYITAGLGPMTDWHIEIYDPIAGDWVGRSDSKAILDYTVVISNATVTLTLKYADDTHVEKLGYDYNTQVWHNNKPTTPMAYFRAQPTHGLALCGSGLPTCPSAPPVGLGGLTKKLAATNAAVIIPTPKAASIIPN